MQSIHEVKGVLKIAAPESLTISRLGPIIREYSMKYPNVNIILSNGTCGQNQVELVSGRVDIAFMVYPEIQMEKCIHHSLLEERIVLVAGSDAPEHFDDYQQSGKHFLLQMKKDAAIGLCLNDFSSSMISVIYKQWNCGA